MNYIGAHISSSGGVDKTVFTCCSNKATAFSFLLKISSMVYFSINAKKNRFLENYVLSIHLHSNFTS